MCRGRPSPEKMLSQPFTPNTQWSTGAKTMTVQSAMKTRKGPNLARSAKAPVMSAGVMMA